MKSLSFLLVGISLCFTCFAQTPTIKWGEEFKLHKGSGNPEIISVDKSGAYLQERHQAIVRYCLLITTARECAGLIKMDKNLKEVYRKDFYKELKGKQFRQFFTLQDKMFLISSAYNRPNKTDIIYAAAINKSTGELTEELKEVASLQKDQKSDIIDFKITYNADSTNIVMVSTIRGKERNEYKVQKFDKNFKPSGNPVVLTNEFEAKKYQLQDLLYLSNNKILLVGRVYEYAQDKNQKSKSLHFINYNIRLYNDKGEQQSEINTTFNGKWLNSTKLVHEKNKDLVLAAFYSNSEKSGTINGMLVQRININDGSVISTSNKEINNSLITANNDDDKDGDDDKDNKRKERENRNKPKNESALFSKYMQFRNIFYTADNGLVILAEPYHHYVTSIYIPGAPSVVGGGTSGTFTSTYHYLSGDLMMCKINDNGNIAWMEIVPKDQRETTSTPSTINSGSEYNYSGYFESEDRPCYSGFGAMQINGNIKVIFNDSPQNINVTHAGLKTKKVITYDDSDCYLLSIDAISGKVERKKFFSNNNTPIVMPHLASIINNEMYVVGKTNFIWSKSKLAVAKITVR
ncbi:hypothetical protein [Chitinophaga agri]|uniref:Uncharacterized protein n=1 Tax=Chitinophaga agri TaxID=2703787 RepID=A0A6B9ZJU1_9BACT|nr:hypothetical protein [Chitinophaga agri]QHS60883.1 hypothetical protein GWR21_15155 [Chitinophaga agri]